MKKDTQTIVLNDDGIQHASETARNLFHTWIKDNRQATAAWLTFENDLLKLREHFGEDTEAQIISKNELDRRCLRIMVRGERFDPRDEGNSDRWEDATRATSGMTPSYEYLGGCNIITHTAARKSLSSLARIVVALLLGIVASCAGTAFLSQEMRSGLLDSVVQPTFDLLVGMLAGIAGPLVFFSMAWGICGIGNATVIGRKGTALLKCFLGMNALAVVLASVASQLAFGWSTTSANADGGLLLRIYKMLVALIPTNLIKPFLEGHTPQIIVLAVIVGISVLAIGSAVGGVRSFVRQGNALMQFLMKQLCRLVPVIIFVMTISQVWSGAFTKLASSWLPILLAVALMLANFLLQAIVTSRRIGVPLPKLLRMCMPAMIVGFTTASSPAAMNYELSVCTEDLGTSKEDASFGVPLSMVLCRPSTAIEIAVVMAFAMHTYGSGGDLVWYVHLAVASCLYAIVVPPVPGGMIACYGMMLTELGIPMEALALLTALDVILDYPCTGTVVGSHILAIARTSLGKAD